VVAVLASGMLIRQCAAMQSEFADILLSTSASTPARTGSFANSSLVALLHQVWKHLWRPGLPR
jgi:hypothetical protein